MSEMSIIARAPLFATVAFAAALTFGTAPAQAGAFSNLAGTWAGGGTVGIGNGVNEPIRCRAVYSVGGGGDAASLQLRCASESYRFEFQGNVRYQNGAVLGNWSESTRGIAGGIAGTTKGPQIEVRVEGQTFVALLSLTTRGDRQSISIRTPSGSSEMTGANITLTRRG